MTRNSVVAFGLSATAAAMGAKCGQTSLRSRMDLAIATLRMVPVMKRLAPPWPTSLCRVSATR